MIIRSLRINRHYRYLWLKHITGVDLSQHCARCLIGDYERTVNRATRECRDIVLGDKYVAHYLCGVINYADNLHCAIMRKDGAHTEAHDEKFDIVIDGGVIVPISAASIPASAPHAGERAFYTCRNWQFANWLKANNLS